MVSSQVTVRAAPPLCEVSALLCSARCIHSIDRANTACVLVRMRSSQVYVLNAALRLVPSS